MLSCSLGNVGVSLSPTAVVLSFVPAMPIRRLRILTKGYMTRLLSSTVRDGSMQRTAQRRDL